jgi:hypothetical protein
MLATDPRYRDREWDMIEHSNETWVEFKEVVRRAWDTVRGRRSAQYVSPK